MIEETTTLAPADVTVEKMAAPQTNPKFIFFDNDPTDPVFFDPGDDSGADGDAF